ncbi:hypothetical protein Dsin_003130 [Dipteronia sinensis]|uniref:Uncharacterized protein n=1 Tax=Dipteronia sinensis TaxID=43782 RepID=A0AAE0EKC1_9ROSI|nr:hypothetical protein Dsin_003130 [Dipteronia sinensis]
MREQCFVQNNAFLQAMRELVLRAVDRYKRSPAFDAFMYRGYCNGMKTAHAFYSARIQATETAVNRFKGFMEEGWRKALCSINDQQKNWRAHRRQVHVDPLLMHLEMVGESAFPTFYAQNEATVLEDFDMGPPIGYRYMLLDSEEEDD